jgi:hypothetical protein
MIVTPPALEQRRRALELVLQASAARRGRPGLLPSGVLEVCGHLDHLAGFARRLNNRPRKTLGYMNHQKSSPTFLRTPVERVRFSFT